MSALFPDIVRLLEEQDSYAAVQRIREQQQSPQAAIDVFADTMQRLYSERHDVPGMIAVGRAGIQFGLQAADDGGADHADDLRGAAKAMAFNLAANTWPGWNDEGICLTRSDRLVGLDAAHLNLRLARELRRDDLALCNAHWILAAHLLADGRFDDARAEFDRAETHARSAGRADYELMCRGYSAMTADLAEPYLTEPRCRFDRCVDELRALDTDDSRFFADQLEAVLELFSAPRPEPA